MRRLSCLIVVGCMVLLGCSGEPEPAASAEKEVVFVDWQALEPGQMTVDQKARHELCLAATNAMAAELMGALVSALDAEIKKIIDETYPEDRAIGFVEGDLRGWFWIEASPSA